MGFRLLFVVVFLVRNAGGVRRFEWRQLIVCARMLSQ